jgi:hypothetical protein
MEAGEYHGAVGLFSEQMFQHMQRSPVEIADSLLAHKRDRLGALKSFKFLSGEARSQRQLSGSTTQCLLHYEVVYEKLTVQESFRLSKRGGDPFQIEWYGIRCLHCSKGKANSMCSMKSMDGVRP